MRKTNRIPKNSNEAERFVWHAYFHYLAIPRESYCALVDAKIILRNALNALRAENNVPMLKA